MATPRKTAPKAAAKKAPAKPVDPAKEERSNKLRQAYGTATARLREAHREEFDDYYEDEAKSLGVDYKRRLNPEQKAEADLLALLEKYPHLREKVADTDDGQEYEDADLPEDEDEGEVKQFNTA